MPEKSKPKPHLPLSHRLLLSSRWKPHLLLSSRWKPYLLLRSFLLRMGDLGEATSREVAVKLGTLRWVTVVIGVGNLGLVFLGAYMMVGMIFGCAGEVRFPFAVVSLVAGIRLLCTVGAGFAQVATAATIVSYPTECSAAADAFARHDRRVRYRRWLWWTRFGIGVTILQFVGALYLTFVIVKDFSYDGKSKECFLGWNIETRGRKWISMVLFVVIAWLVVTIQCFTGSDVLRWRSFYSTHDTAWKAHYLEVFDHGIREALCCLGRVKYLSVLEEDEVSSVARLLGDLVAYRASGTGHLEFLAGLALLQRHKESPHLYGEVVEAPHERIREASAFHQFAEAAYTGPLLDFGRNPLLFPCAWLYRQGFLTPWNRARRPVLQGDNWWRGHAAAFLKYVNLPPNALRKGRVSQTKREAAYFVMVLHHLQSVVIAVRGTETPEDLLTDVLCRECALTEDDLDGLINSIHLCPEVRKKVISSFPHYGHSGIIESARELFMQIDGLPEVKDGHASGTTGFLSSLLGAGQECYGYRVCIVGHSLGGSVATLLGLRLYRRFPNLHVYSYGTLPCVDSIVAEACSDFVTSIVYNDEFSARLSVTSIIRLRAAAITALSDDSSADSAMILKLARRLLNVNNHQEIEEVSHSGCNVDSSTMKVEESNNVHRRNIKQAIKGGGFLCSHAVTCVVNMPAHCHCLHTKADCLKVSTGSVPEAEGVSRIRSPKHSVAVDESVHKYHSQEETSLISCSNVINEENGSVNCRDISEDSANSKNFEGTSDVNLCENGTIGFPNNTSPSVDISVEDPPEMFLPGLVIHIVPEERTILPLWKSWRAKDKKQVYRAFVANREHFKDIIVTPYMFLDHLPWRCNYAMQRVLETWRAHGQLVDNFRMEYMQSEIQSSLHNS